MNCAIAHCGGKSIYFSVCLCSYHSLGDLSTTLEMTVLFILSFRGFEKPEESPGKVNFLVVISTK